MKHLDKDIFRVASIVTFSFMMSGCLLATSKKCHNVVCFSPLDFIPILSGSNPGHEAALNMIPLDPEVLRKIGATEEEVSAYNWEIDSVTQLDKKLTDEFNLVSSRTEDHELLNRVALSNGFESGTQLVETLKRDTLSATDLSRFADANRLSESQARIYLKVRFGITTEVK